MEETLFTVLGDCRNPRAQPRRARHGGLRPCYSFRFSDQWKFSRACLPALDAVRDCEGIPFDADLGALVRQARRPLNRLEADFAWLALAVYLADRFAPRHPHGGDGTTFWRRRIHMHLPVSDPAMWASANALLVPVLEFLTEDDWSFEFSAGRALFAEERQEHFLAIRGAQVDWTGLFSGGLDSLAGALHRFVRTEGVGLLMSGQTHNRIIAGQEALVARMREQFRHRVEHLGVGYGVPDKRGLTGFESSQRARAFIHTALGSLAAIISGCHQLFLFENGFGALNLACDAAQLGSQNSRGTHPVFLRRMAALVATVFSRPFSIENPFAFSTKSQMLAAAGARPFAHLFPVSFSCDRYPNYPHKASQCGCCASCLVRRLAFHAAGLADDGTSYSADIFLTRRALPESQLLALSKLTIQADALAQALRATAPWQALCASWPDLLRTDFELGEPGFRENTLSLLRRHVAEWQSFLNGIKTARLAIAA